MVVDPRYFRPTEVDYLLGDASKAREAFGWAPSVPFQQLVRMMVDHDVRLGEQDRLIQSTLYPAAPAQVAIVA